MIGAVSLATPILDGEDARRWFDWPGVLLTAQVPLLVLIVAAAFFWTMRQKREVWPFLLSLGLFAVTFAGLGVSVFPYAVPDEITLWQAAAPASSQLFMLSSRIGESLRTAQDWSCVKLMSVLISISGSCFWERTAVCWSQTA